MQTSRMTSLVVLAASLLLGGCPNSIAVQCEQDSNCNIPPGGVCVAAPTGHRWCSHVDSSCSSGLRYDKDDKYPETGDGLAGVCVAAMVDAGIPPDVVSPVDAALPSRPLSCIALPHTCGASSADDCCTSLLVTGGTYFRGYDVAQDRFSGDMNSPATISSFPLDKYEVTVGRFRAFVADGQGTQAKHPATGAGTHAHIDGSGWEASWNASLPADTAALMAAVKCGLPTQTWTDAPGPNENRPINCVSWYEAAAFCAWDGGYLPTEAEWNYAATGGDQQRAYPWSDPSGSLTIDVSRASYAIYNDAALMFECLANGTPDCDVTDLIEVGTKPSGDGRWGHSDLAGNVWEWMLDDFAPYRVPCTDCANVPTSGARVFRGGSFNIDPTNLRTGARVGDDPLRRSANLGIRCARSVN